LLDKFGLVQEPIPLYNMHATFWENLVEGPRNLTENEQNKLTSLNNETQELKGQNGVDLKIKLFEKTIDSPVGLCAGPAYGYQWLNFYSNLGYDILTQKTVRGDYLEPHPLPNIVNIEGNWSDGFILSEKFTGSITNSFGIGSLAPKDWMKDLERMVKNLPQGKTFKISVIPHTSRKTLEETINSFVELSLMVKQVGADGVEFDLSCPNFIASEGMKGEIYQDAKFTLEITEAVRNEVGNDFPILLKVGYMKGYNKLVEEVGTIASGIVAINAMPAPVHRKDGSYVFADRGNKAGVCGLALLNMGLDAVRQLVKIREANSSNFAIIGVGGILNPEIAMKYLELGADAIEIGTGAIYDPFLALEIKKALLEKKVSES